MESTSADSSSVVTFGSGGNAVPALVTSGEEATGSAAADVEVECAPTLNADQQLELEIARARQKSKSRRDAENESALASDQDRLSLQRLPSAATRKRSSTPNTVSSGPQGSSIKRGSRSFSPRSPQAANFGRKTSSSAASRTSSHRITNDGTAPQVNSSATHQSVALMGEVNAMRSRVEKAEQQIIKVEHELAEERAGEITRIEQLERQRDTTASQVLHLHQRHEHNAAMLMHKVVHSETEAQLELSHANRQVEEAKQIALEQELRAQRAHAACVEMQSASEQEVHLYRTQFHQMQVGMLQEINQFQEAESGNLDHSRRQMAMVKLSENVSRTNSENATLRGELLMEEQRASEQKVLEQQLQLLEEKYQQSEMAISDRMKEKDNETIRLREMLQHTQYVAHQEQQRVLLAEMEVEAANTRQQHIEAFQQLDNQSSSRRVTGLHHECEELRRALHERDEEFKQMRHRVVQMQTSREVPVCYGNVGSAPLRTTSSCRSSEPDWEMLSSVQPSSQVASSLRQECKSEPAPSLRTQYYNIGSDHQSPPQTSPMQEAPMMCGQTDPVGQRGIQPGAHTMSSSGSLPATSSRRWSTSRQGLTTTVSGTRPARSASEVNDVEPNSASTLETVPVPSGSKVPSIASSLVSESRVRHIISENLGGMQEQMKTQYEELYRMLQEQTMQQVWNRGADHLFVPPASIPCAGTSTPVRNFTASAGEPQREMHYPDPATPVPHQDVVTPALNRRGADQERFRERGDGSTHENARVDDPWSRASMPAAPPGLPGRVLQATPVAKSEAASAPTRPTSVSRSATGRTSAPTFDPWANYHPTIGPGGNTEIDPHGRIHVGPVIPPSGDDHMLSSAAKAMACPKASGMSGGEFVHAPPLGRGAGSDPHDNPWWMHVMHPDNPYLGQGGPGGDHPGDEPPPDPSFSPPSEGSPEKHSSYRTPDGGGGGPPDGGSPGGSEHYPRSSHGPKITRKEADKVVVPPYPKIMNLESWQSQLITGILAACADSDHDTWIQWTNKALLPKPDIEDLNYSGGTRFNSIDIKLANAMLGMLKQASAIEEASELLIEVTQKTNLYIKARSGVIKGRQIVAMLMESFRTRDRTDVIYSIEFLTKLQYPGDHKLLQFRASWHQILGRMRPADIPSDNMLRDILYAKVKGSKEMRFELEMYFELVSYDHPARTYTNLLNIIDRNIARRRENRNSDLTQAGLHSLVQGKHPYAAPAPKGEEGDEPAAPVIPEGAPRHHGKPHKGGKGKGKGGKDRSRSPSGSSDGRKKKVPCRDYAKGKCKFGRKCRFYHGRSSSPRAKTKSAPKAALASGRPGSPSPPGDKSCFQFMKFGKCDRENCPYKHASPAIPSETVEDAAPAEGKTKATTKGKTKGGPAAPAVFMGDDNADSDYDSSINDSDSDADSEMSTECEKDGCFALPSHAKTPTARLRSKMKMKVRFAQSVNFKASCPRKSLYEMGKAVVKRDPINEVEEDRALFEKHKARARAQLMTNMVVSEDEVTYDISVRLPGTKQVVCIYYDENKGSFVEDVTSYEAFNAVISATHCEVCPEHLNAKIKFIMDTGCGHDLISSEKVTKHNLETFVGNETMKFQTANGATTTDVVAKCKTDSFDEPIEAHVMENSPSVLSVGKRCMNHGYTFVWPYGREPFMINPDGGRIQFQVRGDIPYLKLGKKASEVRSDPEATAIKVLMDEYGVCPQQDQGESRTTTQTKPSQVIGSEDAAPGIEEFAGESDDDIPPYAGESDDDIPPFHDDLEEEDISAFIDADEVSDEEYDPRDDQEADGDEGGEEEEEREDDPEVEAGSDEEEIDLEEDDGVPRKAKRGTLKAEAKTLEHLCTHRFRNPYCEACVRAKMRHWRTHKNAFKRPISKWGDLVTLDFVDMRKASDRGIFDGEPDREILVMKDIATKMIGALPTRDRSTESVIDCIKKFAGNKKIKLMYSDEAREFGSAAREMGIPIDHSLPGRPLNNSIAERTNQFVINTTATSLLQAGLPAAYWPYALNCVSNNLNIEDVDGESAWFRAKGKWFPGKAIPFGAKVYFKPSDARPKTYDGKFDPKGIPGIFAGMSKRQGCISHSTPEAEIVAADHALSRVGLPAITLWCCLGGKEPNFVFYDDNQTMISVVRTGKNPTMRHLERSHGISVAWMHDVFQASYVSLAYEVTAKMAADIHTKAFRDGLSWQHACQLINIFPPQQLSSQEIMDLMRPTHSQSADARGQKLLTYRNEVPCFPYTDTPILPQVLYREGLSSKEGLQELDGTDPILVVKFPKLLRVPPRTLHPGRYLRSTWVLREGVWKQIEDRAVIPAETQKFDRYVERAVFQYHFQRQGPPGSAPPAAVTVVRPLSFSGSGVSVSLRSAAPATRLVVALLTLAAHGGSRGVVSRRSFRDFVSDWRGSGSVDGQLVWSVVAHALSSAVSAGNAAKSWCFVPENITVQAGESRTCSVVLADGKDNEIASCKVLAHEITIDSERARAEIENASIQGCCVWGARIVLKEASPQSPVWMLHGVPTENWWNRHAPEGIQIVHVPLKTEGQLATIDLLNACVKRYLKSNRDVLFVGAECLHVGSWLAVEHDRTDYGPPQPFFEQEPLGHIGQCISDAVKVGQKNMILELPVGDLESSSIMSSGQIKSLMRSATSVVTFDGCCFGHRTKPGKGETHNVQYIKSRWRFMSWGIDLRVDDCWKLCTKQHIHAQNVVNMCDAVHAGSSGRAVVQKHVPESRSSKVSRRIIKAVLSQTCEAGGGAGRTKSGTYRQESTM